MAKKAYVVFCGRRTGIYTDWPTCNAQVSGYSNAVFVGYDSISEAEKAWASYLRDTSASARVRHDFDCINVQVHSTIISFLIKLAVIIFVCWVISKLVISVD
jgi:viroplasmin and RNaseH domain-containing protein